MKYILIYNIRHYYCEVITPLFRLKSFAKLLWFKSFNHCYFSFERATWVRDVTVGVSGDDQPGVAGEAEQEVHQGAGQVGHDWYHHQTFDWSERWPHTDCEPDEAKIQHFHQVCI